MREVGPQMGRSWEEEAVANLVAWKHRTNLQIHTVPCGMHVKGFLPSLFPGTPNPNFISFPKHLESLLAWPDGFLGIPGHRSLEANRLSFPSFIQPLLALPKPWITVSMADAYHWVGTRGSSLQV